MYDSWQWLVGTFWYVPHSNLTAPLFSGVQQPQWLSDQTVWQITGYENGYFWGNTAVRMHVPAASTRPAPVAQLLTASITPEGNIYMYFIPVDSSANWQGATGNIGIGNMRWQDGAWRAQMQMSAPQSGNTAVLHWAYMQQCKPGDAAWQQLPGTEQSVPEFLMAAGFTAD